MNTTDAFNSFTARLLEFIPRSLKLPGTAAEFNEIALELFRLQFETVPAYRALCHARNIKPDLVDEWKRIPAVPTAAFKELELTSLAPSERIRVFRSSGTTEQRPSRHFHSAESLAVYEASLLPWFQVHLLGAAVEAGQGGERMLFLTPSSSAAPNSSLVHMFETLRRECGLADSEFLGVTDENGAWTVDVDRTISILCDRMEEPLVLLGTAFSFVHLIDALAARNLRLTLPEGSRVMETGGYKGRSREIPKPELHNLTSRILGVPIESIVTEYGMSELSSQGYDRMVQGSRFKVQGSPRDDCRGGDGSSPASLANMGTSNPRPVSGQAGNFQFPPWARVQIVSPETGREVAESETGLIRVFDLANVRSVMAVQTEDLGIRRGGGFELIGRARLAEPRGCSLMTD